MIQEVLIQMQGRWFIVHLGLAKDHHADLRAWWTERDGKIICLIGQEQRIVDLATL